jgi:hypothetical protein
MNARRDPETVFILAALERAKIVLPLSLADGLDETD